MLYIKKRLNAFFRYLFLMTCAICLCGCDTPSVSNDLKSDYASCWPCSLYKTVFDAIGSTIDALYVTMTSLGLTFLGFGLLFYLAFYSLRLVSSFKDPNLKKEITSLIQVLFKVALVGVVLGVPSFLLSFLDTVLTPIILFFLELSRQILMSISDIDPSLTSLITPETISTSSGQSHQLFTGEISYRMQDIVYRIYIALKSGMGLGSFIMASKTFVSFFMGPIVMLMFLCLMFIFPFSFIDSILRIGVAIILAPFLLAAWPFPPTKEWIMKGLNIIIGGMITLLFSCIYVGLLISIITTYANQIEPGFMSNARQTMDPDIALSMQQMSPNMFAFMVLLFALTLLANKISQLAAAFGGDGSGNALLSFLNGLKQLAISAATIAAGAAITAVGGGAIGKKLMQKGAKDMKKEAVQQAKEAVKAAKE